MVPYADAVPDSAFVLPSRISVGVMPTSVWAAGWLEPPHAARVTRQAAIAAKRDPALAIDSSPLNDRLNPGGIATLHWLPGRHRGLWRNVPRLASPAY